MDEELRPNTAGETTPRAAERLTAQSRAIEHAILQHFRAEVERRGADATPEEFEIVADAVHTESIAALRDLLKSAPPKYAEAVEARAPEVLEQIHREIHGFEDRLRDVWGDAFDRLEVLRHFFVEIGESYLDDSGRVRHQATDDATLDAATDQPLDATLSLTLTQLHVRACRVTDEIIVQLKAGLPDGAHARWRTLHELAVIVSVLRKGGEEMAIRYLAHQRVTALKTARRLNEYAERLKWDPVPDAEIAGLATEVAALVARYGKAFKTDYGWASPNGIAEPTLDQLERAAGIEHWRPFFGWASAAVHGGAKGLISLGAGTSPDPTLLVPGRSNAGLADPGQSTALTMLIICGAFLEHRPTADRTIQVRAFDLLAKRAQVAFIEANDIVEARTVALRQARHEEAD